MQEVFENIIKKLEEKFKYNSEQAEIWRSGENVDAFMIGRSDDYIDRANCYGEAIEIVKQASAEYNKSLMTELIEAKKNCGEDSDCSECVFGQVTDRCYLQELEMDNNNGWIPVKTRPMTEEEREYYEYDDCGVIYDCPLPDDGQEVLITSKCGYVEKTTFYTDMGCYFENYEDYDDVIAWMPLIAPYQPKGE